MNLNVAHRLVTAVALGAALLVPAVAAAEGKPAEKSLYDRLGGVGPLAMVVDDFIERLAVDKALNQNPKIKEARARVPNAYLKFHVTTLVCQVTGGPCKYVGRGMKESHAHLAITEKDWNRMAAIFKGVLDKFKVPEKEQQELFAIVGTTKADIVVAGAAPNVDLKELSAHLEGHVSYPASKAELVAACNGLADFSPADKRWFTERLPDGKYASAPEVLKALGLAR